MADVTVTAAEVLQQTGTPGTQTGTGTAGATVTAGQTVYLDSTDNELKLADADGSSDTADVRGIALHGASDGQPLTYALGGTLDPGFTVTVGTVYVQSTTPGGIAPLADLLTDDFVTILGVGTAADTLDLIMKSTGKQVP